MIATLVMLGGTVAACSGEERVTVPDLVGMEQAEAEEALTDLGLELGEVEHELVSASSERLGTVLLQDPRPGTEVDSGTEVAVVVAATSEGETASPAAGSGGSGSNGGSGSGTTPTPESTPTGVLRSLSSASGTGDYTGPWFETTGAPLRLTGSVSSSSGDYTNFHLEPQMGSWQGYVLVIDLDYTLPPVERTFKHDKLTPGTYRIRVNCEPGDVEWSFNVREYTGVQLAPDKPLVPTN